MLDPGREPEVGDDPEHRVVLVAALGRREPELRVRVCPGAVNREGGQGDDGHARVHAEDGEEDEVDRPRHILIGVARLLGHVRDGLDARVGEHGQREREHRVVPRRNRAEVDLVDEERGIQDEEGADDYDQHLGPEIDDGEDEVELGRLADPADVQPGQ